MDIKWNEQWAEVGATLFVVLGFMISILQFNALLSYVSIVLAGFLAGRIYYTKRFTEPILPFILIIIGFLVGYLIGNFWSSRLLSLILFILSFSCSYLLHKRKIIGIFKSENFIK
jgi:uncharacterized membrane protein YeaQ/YmgE (transglycosylase-associated protein family)